MKSSSRSLFFSRPLACLTTFTGLFVPLSTIHAADIEWDGGAADGGLLTTGVNWAGDVFPGNGNRGVIGNGETAMINATTGNVSIGSLRIVNGSLQQTGQSLTVTLANGSGVTTEFMVGTSGSGTASATFTNATVSRTGDNFGFLIGDANGATVLNANTPVASSGSVTLWPGPNTAPSGSREAASSSERWSRRSDGLTTAASLDLQPVDRQRGTG